MTDIESHVITDANRAAITKFYTMRVRAIGSGAANVKLQEAQRNVAVQLQDAHEQLTFHLAYTPERFDAGALPGLGLQSVDAGAANRMVQQHNESEHAGKAARIARARERIAMLELRNELIAAELSRVNHTNVGLFGTAASLQKHLTEKAIIKHEDFQ